ncbi:MAG: hypothetical protein AMS22_01725 [Thiotrichales bacterium SG8_50]|nr:MAG: hypothetical protein AMS22_01725 [Thiotrichales bacterium SG8_50]
MIKQALAIAALIGLSGAAFGGAAPQWPQNAENEQDPRVVAFYEGRCTNFADEQGLSGTERENFIAQCRHNAPEVWPVGLDHKDGGSE